MHTSYVSACAVSTGKEQIRAYKDKGYAGIIVTDHFINGNTTCPKHISWKKRMEFIAAGYEKTKEEGDKRGLDVFFGWEFSIRYSDFLTYGLGLDFLIENPDIDKLNIEGYSRLVRKCGGYIAQAHPYRDAWYIENKFPVEPCFIDGIEVYNTSDNKETNGKALAFAKRHNLPMQAGSDSHDSYMPFLSGIKLQKKAESIFDIINAIKSRDAALILPGEQMFF